MKTQKWYHKKILCIPIWAIGFAVLITAAGYAQQQTLQLATYYPAPYGEYTQMRVAEKLEILSPKGNLQVTKGAGISRTGLQVDLTKQDPEAIQLSSFSDINNTNYVVDPSAESKFKTIKLNEVPASAWPVLAYPNGSFLPSPVKMYFGKAVTGGKAIANIKPGGMGFNFASSDYFVMISPQQLYSAWTLPEHTHRQAPRFPNRRTEGNGAHTINFNYYKFTIVKATSNFIVTFEGTIPTEFDWIAIGN